MIKQAANARQTKVCSKCQVEFECGNQGPGCWCESVVLSDETLTEMRTIADDCLCPNCLRGFSKREFTG
jgi:hypothetical protein